MRGGARSVDLFTRAYVGVFVVALLAALPWSGDAQAKSAASSTSTSASVAPAAGSTSTSPPAAPTTAAVMAVAPVAAAPLPLLDIEHHLATSTVDGHPAVVLSFDDGPHPFFTPRVLDVLQSRGIKAVFCLVGTEIAKYPNLVARIAAEGHALCNHSENHDTHMSRKDPAYVAAMIQHPSDLIRDITGKAPTLYRGPGGDLSVFIIERAHQLGMRILGWSVDPADYFKPGAITIQDRIMGRMHPGAVVLMHDAGGERTQTVEQLAGLIDRLRASGYAFVLP